MEYWPLQDAKARFSELVSHCRETGPQMVTRHGEPAVVLVPSEDWERISRPRQSLADFFRAAPRFDLVIERSRDLPRELEL